MEKWKKDSRKEAMVVDIDMLVPKTHLLRKIEKVMDYDWLYEKLEPYYCHDNGRPGTDPVVDQDDIDPAPVWDTVIEADMAGDRGQCGIPVVSGV